MKNASSVFFLVWILSGCAAQKESWTGSTPVKEIADAFPWFTQGYASYSPDSSAIRELKLRLPAYTLLVFGGTWCGDTKALLPKFYKVIDEAGFPREKVELYLLDERKRSPLKMEAGYAISEIPVFILLKDGKETGRIVEETKVSIEKDLAELINK